MRLISIGKSPSCTICIPNDYISSYHAELVLLDNGDIFLTDCESKNGTFVNGKQITPYVEVPVRRGDRIEFDNIALNWGSVPAIEVPDPSKVKGIYGVGKSSRNRYVLNGDSVSRYHATIKEMKNGTFFIIDHSKNGTFVNGNRIPANQEVRIKASDSIVCGNIPCPNPVPGPTVPKWIWAAIGGIAAAVALVFGFIHFFPLGHDTNPYKAVVLVQADYIIRVHFADDPVKELLNIEDWYIGEGVMLATSSDQAESYRHYGTAFFVSEDGLMVTNKHVTNRLYADEKYDQGSMSSEMKTLAEYTRQLYYDNYTSRYRLTTEQYVLFDRWLKSPFTLEVVPISFGIRYSGRTYSSILEFDWAHLVAESDDDNADVALLRLNSRKTPEFADWFDITRAIPLSDLKLDESYYTLGFPAGELLATLGDKNKYEPTSGVLHMTRNPGKYLLYFQGDKTIGGQSGSPIYDKKHRLVGVLYGGITLTDNTNACPFSYAIHLIEEAESSDNAIKSFSANNAY